MLKCLKIKSETSFKAFILNEHRKNNLNNFFPMRKCFSFFTGLSYCTNSTLCSVLCAFMLLICLKAFFRLLCVRKQSQAPKIEKAFACSNLGARLSKEPQNVVDDQDWKLGAWEESNRWFWQMGSSWAGLGRCETSVGEMVADRSGNLRYHLTAREEGRASQHMAKE